MHSRAFLVPSALCVLFALSSLRAAEMPAGHPPIAPALSPTDLQFFETKIRPILTAKCYSCHSKEADKVRGGFLLDTREALLHGGNSGPALVAGNPNDSLLIKAVRYTDDDLQMPPKEKLSPQQIADLTEWVRRGAPDPRTLVTKGSSNAYGGVGKQHWSFQPVNKPAVPAVQNAAWVKNPIDNFVLAKLEASEMKPNAPADKATLIRRVYFDLVGLPPSVRDVEAFVNDPAPDAYEKIVDRLLASPFYGEHWARYWLDVARYSDTKGDAKNREDIRYPHAWTYRDWVITALNADLPYNEFIVQQLAGDRVQAAAEKRAKDRGQPPPPTRTPMAAMGFLSLGNRFDGRVDDIVGDQIDVTTKAFLGLTVACARCHDHKFDPIPTKDYYSLYGVFRNTDAPAELPTLQVDIPQTADLLDYQAKAAEFAKQRTALEIERRELAAIAGPANGKARPKQAAKARQPAKSEEAVKAGEAIKAAMANGATIRDLRQKFQQRETQLQRAIGDLESTHPGAPARVNALVDVPRSIDYPVLLRGEVGNRGEVVPRRFLEILSPDPKKRPEWRGTGSGRIELALAIADPKNPLTARVLVNRLWQQHWGAGLVSTPDDLGNMSAPPTHPELLDWLAATFVENKWSIKSMHRAMVLSATYQQSSRTDADYAARDPDNKLLWRYNLRRMTLEQTHDALLAITGELEPKLGGKAVPISSEDFAQRRAIYTLIDRRNPPELLTQFDFPSPDVSTGRRYETIVPQQALFLMNSPMVIETARKLVERPGFAKLDSDQDRVLALYLLIYQRKPTAQEVALGMGYVNANPQGVDLEMPAALPARGRGGPVSREQKQADRKEAAMARKGGGPGGPVGGAVAGKPINAWTKLAHALLQSNEAMFYR